jgi:hypothetical protein
VKGSSSATSNTGCGVLGETSATNQGVGVKGWAPNGSTAIWGYNSGGASSTAGWFDGLVYANGSALTSDARLKKEIADLSYGLNAVVQLHPVTFKWKSGDDVRHLGLIAQEVATVVPEVVAHPQSPSGENVLTVSYNELVPILIKAIQEQNRIIAQQSARISAVEQGSSVRKLSSVLGGGVVVGMLPLGMILAIRRRRKISPS